MNILTLSMSMAQVLSCRPRGAHSKCPQQYGCQFKLSSLAWELFMIDASPQLPCIPLVQRSIAEIERVTPQMVAYSVGQDYSSPPSTSCGFVTRACF